MKKDETTLTKLKPADEKLLFFLICTKPDPTKLLEMGFRPLSAQKAQQ